MDYKYIEQLLDRYFESGTTLAEERILKAFFSQHDVPSHLVQYADLFDYTSEQCEHSDTLGKDFDARVLQRLQQTKDAPEIHVKMQRINAFDRLRPLWRSAAAVAIVALVGGSVHHAYVNFPVDPIMQGTGGYEAVEGQQPEDLNYDTRQFLHEGEKVAITTDTIPVTSKVD